MEEQQSQREEPREGLRQTLTPDELAKRRLKEGLTLNRKRITRQLENVQNSHHRAMLETALFHLDSELARIG